MYTYPTCVVDRFSLLYRAIARPSRPTAPAKLMATLPVAMGAPPVEVEEAALEEGEAEPEAAVEPDEVDAAVVCIAAEPLEPEAVEAAVVWTAAEPVEPEVESAESAESAVGVAAVRPSSPAEVAQALTLAGRLLYQAGIVPASISAIMEDCEAGLARSLYHDAGMAVSRTVKMELGTSERAAAASPRSLSEPSVTVESLVPWGAGAARARVEKKRAARTLDCILTSVYLKV